MRNDVWGTLTPRVIQRFNLINHLHDNISFIQHLHFLASNPVYFFVIIPHINYLYLSPCLGVYFLEIKKTKTQNYHEFEWGKKQLCFIWLVWYSSKGGWQGRVTSWFLVMGTYIPSLPSPGRACVRGTQSKWFSQMMFLFLSLLLPFHSFLKINCKNILTPWLKNYFNYVSIFITVNYKIINVKLQLWYKQTKVICAVRMTLSLIKITAVLKLHYSSADILKVSILLSILKLCYYLAHCKTTTHGCSLCLECCTFFLFMLSPTVEQLPLCQVILQPQNSWVFHN